LVKSVSPFLALRIHVKVNTVALLTGLSFILVSFSTDHLTTFMGVVAASMSSGLGEVTFLSYSHFFEANVISTWSSGTGGAGVIGAGSYATLTYLGLSPQHTVLLMLVVPLGLLATFYGVLSPDRKTQPSRDDQEPLLEQTEENESLESEETQSEVEIEVISPEVVQTPVDNVLTFKKKLEVTKVLLWRFMIPLGLVYFFEYLINQGLFELVYFPESETWPEHSQQYRAYQLIYQLGVLISRSSLHIITIKRIYLLSLLQGINFLLFTLQSVFWVLPASSGIFFVFLAILWEGLLGGSAYVNTFHRISEDSRDSEREFSLGIASLADSTAIGLAGLAALPIHNLICDLPL